MAGANYNRNRYYTRSQQLSEQRDDLNTIIKLRVDRDRWRKVAETLALELGKVEYAQVEYDNLSEEGSNG